MAFKLAKVKIEKFCIIKHIRMLRIPDLISKTVTREAISKSVKVVKTTSSKEIQYQS